MVDDFDLETFLISVLRDPPVSVEVDFAREVASRSRIRIGDSCYDRAGEAANELRVAPIEPIVRGLIQQGVTGERAKEAVAGLIRDIRGRPAVVAGGQLFVRSGP